MEIKKQLIVKQMIKLKMKQFRNPKGIVMYLNALKN